MMLRGATIGIVLATVVLSACQKKPQATISSTPRATAQSVMVGVAKQIQICWFKKKDPIFRKYKMAAELNSFSGRPRILIVPKNNPGGLPKLVAQTERSGGRNNFTSFGPLLETKDGPRLKASLDAWAQGSKTC